MATEASAWLAKLEKLTPEQRQAAGITDEDVAAAKKEHLLERDYTQQKQKLAAYAKLQETYPQATPEQIAQLVEWYLPNSAEVQRLWTNRDKLVERQAEPQPKPAPAGKRKWRDVEAADLYETASLRAALEDLHEDASQAGYQRWQKEYTEKEVPRLDETANRLAGTVIDLMKYYGEDILAAARDPKHTPLDPVELLKQGAARGERDFKKVADKLREERLAAVKPIEEDAFRRGLEEGRKAQDGPTGPLGGPRPGWRPDTSEPAPKTRDELFAKVVSAVEQKSGRPVPL